MGTQNNDPTVLYSSIALLQERFRQLQRIKEMREERELLRMFVEAERLSQSPHCEQPKWFSHPELMQPFRLLHGSSSLGADCPGQRKALQGFETSPAMGSCLNKANSYASKDSNETDVDTSLHL